MLTEFASVPLAGYAPDVPVVVTSGGPGSMLQRALPAASMWLTVGVAVASASAVYDTFLYDALPYA